MKRLHWCSSLQKMSSQACISSCNESWRIAHTSAIASHESSHSTYFPFYWD